MRCGFLLSTSALMLVVGTASAHADVITNPSAVNYQSAMAYLPGGIGEALFDDAGSALLVVSPSTYLQLPSRAKLRSSQGDNSSGNSFVDQFVSAGFSSSFASGPNSGGNGDGPNGPSDSNPGGPGNSGEPGEPGGPGDVNGPGGGGIIPPDVDDPLDGNEPGGGSQPAAVPEPASLLLAGPAALLALRRRNRK